LLEVILFETNKYADKGDSDQDDSINSTPRKHRSKWTPVSIEEMEVFFGILLIMSLVHVPRVKLYWSKDPMYENKRIKNAMRRDRFLDILNFNTFQTLSQLRIMIVFTKFNTLWS
jgi:hypothetical protein